MLNYDFIILVWSFWEGWNRYSVGLCRVFGWTSQNGWTLQGFRLDLPEGLESRPRKS
jgi:hypothetical protein